MPRISCLFALALVACSKPAAPPVDAGPPPVVDAGPPPKPVDASALPKPVWEPDTLANAELKRLDTYAAFSIDGLAVAFAAPSAGAGVPVLSFVSSTTQTVERSVAIADAASRKAVAKELAAAGFPRPSEVKPVPEIIGTKVEDGKVQVTFSGMPAATPFGASDAGATITGAKAIAVSPDGKKLALELTLSGTGEFAGRVVRVVSLFE